MSRVELLKEIRELANKSEAKVSAVQTEAVFNAVLECIRKHTIDDGKLSLTNFGVFSIKTRAPRNAVNPKTQERVQVPERKTVVFRPHTSILESLGNK